jgi:hypothetical protein
MILLMIMRRMSLPSIFHENGKLQISLLEVSKHGNGNLIESNEITKNSVALKDKEMEKEGIKGVNLVMKQALRDKKNATCFMVKNTIPVTLTECFPVNSSFDNGVSAMVIMIDVS